MLTMTEEEVRAIMKAHGWTYKERSPRHVAKYIYAQRGQKYKKLERYICPLSKLEGLTEEELLAKLAPKSDPTL
jgi:hypothetical protein